MSFGIIAAVSLGVTTASTAYSISEAKDAKKAGKKANAIQKKITDLKNKQAKRAFIKNARVEEAKAITGTVGSGGDFESSRAQGQVSSIKTQTRTGLDEHEKIGALGGAVIAAQQKQADSAFNSQVGGQVAGFASQFISFKKNDDGDAG